MSNLEFSTVYKRVSEWNARRYDRVYNKDLAISLLTEELNEYYDAKKLVDRLDALCDTVYVAMGILWKLDLDVETITAAEKEAYEQVTNMLVGHDVEPVYLAAAVLMQYKCESDYPVTLAAHTLITLCMTQMSFMGLKTAEILEALLIVCDSNDSKSVKKTASDVKANGNDKGAFFIAPEPRLQAILDRVEVRNAG